MQELGSGFFGAVYRATYTDKDGARPVAAKNLLVRDGPISVKEKRVFLLEAMVLMEFDHPHSE